MTTATLGFKDPKLCGLCGKNPSKYCCPRCEVIYCSLDCYKCEKHSECSENFYRSCVTEELAGHHTDEESRQKMIEILKKINESDENQEYGHQSLLQDMDNEEDEQPDSDDDTGLDLHERIKDLNLDDADALWDALNEDERNEFEALLNQGNVESIIPQWEPWWSYRKKGKLVEEANQVDDEAKAHEINCPPIVQVPGFSSLTKLDPSSSLRFNITNCIAGYAFTMRYFNGEFEPVEAATYIHTICDNLNKNVNFQDVDVAVESVLQNCLQSNLIQTDTESLEVMRQDIIDIFKGPSKENPAFYCKSALSHLHSIFDQARKSLKNSNDTAKTSKAEFSKKFPEHGTEHLPKLKAARMRAVIKKLEYYLAFLASVS